MNHSEHINELTAALAQAHKEFKPVIRRSENPYFKSKYADLNELIEATRKGLEDNGLALMQFPSRTGEEVRITSLLAHSSGQWITDELSMPVSKSDAQGVGSAITYGRRYAYGAILNIASELDDDGNAAVQRSAEKSALIVGTLLDQSSDEERYWWKVDENVIFCVEGAADYSRLLDRIGYKVEVACWPRGETKLGKKLYQLAKVCEVTKPDADDLTGPLQASVEQAKKRGRSRKEVQAESEPNLAQLTPEQRAEAEKAQAEIERKRPKAPGGQSISPPESETSSSSSTEPEGIEGVF